jgi:hypothetical protein
MKAFLLKYRKTLIFILIGGGLGFAYWRFVGCNSGTCPLTSNWHTSVLMGGLAGYLLVPSREKSKIQDTEEIADRSGE